ncbi:MAG: helix-turn-helix domain-containing protein [Lachnotalea sp.]
MTVGENIKRIRKEKGLTQKKLGELCGINEANIRKYELGNANPKIETIDKIASALGIPLVQIMENITWEQQKNTSEIKLLDKKVSALEGILSILADIYGKVESKELQGKKASGHYYVVDEGDKNFILYDGDIDTLYQAIKSSIPFLIDKMKDTRTEAEVIEAYSKELQ